MKAIWQGVVIAESDDMIVLEDNQYFPRESLVEEHFVASETTTNCPWKGDAQYFHIKVGDAVNEDAAWVYPDPEEAAEAIKGRVAFWKGVEVGE